MIKFIEIVVDTKIFGSNGDELVDVFIFPLRIKFAKFEVTADVDESWSQTTDKIVVNDVIVNSEAILLEFALDIERTCSIVIDKFIVASTVGSIDEVGIQNHTFVSS